MAQAQLITRATHGDSLADILERVLNTGLVIAGDIRIKLCDVELLSIQLRLLDLFGGEGARTWHKLVVANVATTGPVRR